MVIEVAEGGAGRGVSGNEDGADLPPTTPSSLLQSGACGNSRQSPRRRREVVTVALNEEDRLTHVGLPVRGLVRPSAV